MKWVMDKICFHFEQPHVTDGWIIWLDEGEKQQEWDKSSFKPVLPYFKVSLNTEANFLGSLMKLLSVDVKCLGLEGNPDYTTWLHHLQCCSSLDLQVELLRARAFVIAQIISEDGCILHSSELEEVLNLVVQWSVPFCEVIASLFLTWLEGN